MIEDRWHKWPDEKPDNKNKLYNVTVEWCFMGKNTKTVTSAFYDDMGFLCSGMVSIDNYTVTAWRPMPEPYNPATIHATPNTPGATVVVNESKDGGK